MEIHLFNERVNGDVPSTLKIIANTYYEELLWCFIKVMGQPPQGLHISGPPQTIYCLNNPIENNLEKT